MRLALAVILVILAVGAAEAGNRALIDGILGGIGSGMQNLANSMEAQRKEDLERERLRIEQQIADQANANAEAALAESRRQFDAQMAAQREKRAQFDAARRAAAEADQKARGPVPKNTAELAAIEPRIAALAHKLVTLCVDEVRAQDPRSGFDAYIHVEKGVQMWGTKEEYFKFEKCLHTRAPALLESARRP